MPRNKISADSANAPENGSLHLILYITIKERRSKGVSYMKSIGARSGRWEKTNFWDWIKGKIVETYFFYTGEYRIVNSYQLTG